MEDADDFASDLATQAAEAALAAQLPVLPYQFSARALEFLRTFTDKNAFTDALKYLAASLACAEVFSPKEGGNACDMAELEARYMGYFKSTTKMFVLGLQASAIGMPGTQIPLTAELLQRTGVVDITASQYSTLRKETQKEMRNDLTPVVLR